jgi:hypothetical protein
MSTRRPGDKLSTNLLDDDTGNSPVPTRADVRAGWQLIYHVANRAHGSSGPRAVADSQG